MDTMSSGNQSDAEPMSMEILKDIRDVSQYHPGRNRRGACYNIRYCLKQGRAEWKGALFSTRNINFQKNYQFWVNQTQKALT